MIRYLCRNPGPTRGQPPPVGLHLHRGRPRRRLLPLRRGSQRENGIQAAHDISCGRAHVTGNGEGRTLTRAMTRKYFNLQYFNENLQLNTFLFSG